MRLLCSYKQVLVPQLKMTNALDLIDETIAQLETALNIAPGGKIPQLTEKKSAAAPQTKKEKKPKKEKQQQPAAKSKGAVANVNQPEICKLSFKVGVITKVWVHPDADKLYCEEIDVGEETPRLIASGLRPHYTEEGMLGRRLLVVSNLKAKNLVGFKSHGMVLCASETKEDGTQLVEFIEPPEGAPLGEEVTFEGLDKPEPFSPAQVEKKKVFQACLEGLKTTDDCVAAWDGHVFMTTAGPCKCPTIQNGAMH